MCLKSAQEFATACSHACETSSKLRVNVGLASSSVKYVRISLIESTQCFRISSSYGLNRTRLSAMYLTTRRAFVLANSGEFLDTRNIGQLNPDMRLAISLKSRTPALFILFSAPAY